jgi:hypothetical protein
VVQAEGRYLIETRYIYRAMPIENREPNIELYSGFSFTELFQEPVWLFLN